MAIDFAEECVLAFLRKYGPSAEDRILTYVTRVSRVEWLLVKCAIRSLTDTKKIRKGTVARNERFAGKLITVKTTVYYINN